VGEVALARLRCSTLRFERCEENRQDLSPTIYNAACCQPYAGMLGEPLKQRSELVFSEPGLSENGTHGAASNLTTLWNDHGATAGALQADVRTLLAGLVVAKLGKRCETGTARNERRRH
jgi:hypothetical protein